MGAIVSKVQFDRVLGYIDREAEGARLLWAAARPSTALAAASTSSRPCLPM